MRAVFISLAICVACGDDASGASSNSVDGTQTGDTSSSTASDPSTSSTFSSGTTGDGSADTFATASSEGGTTSGVDGTAESTDATSSGSGPGSESETGAVEDPFELCASAATELECDALEPEWTRVINNPSCQWRSVYSIEVSGTECTLLETEPRCVLFDGFLQGCPGTRSCAGPDQDWMFIRELDDTVELLFYPFDEICGPRPHAAPDEAQWDNCNGHPVCECACDVV